MAYYKTASAGIALGILAGIGSALAQAGNLVPITQACDASLALPDLSAPNSLAQPGQFVKSQSMHGVLEYIYGALTLPGAASDSVENRIGQWLEDNKSLFRISNVSSELSLVKILDLDTKLVPQTYAQNPNMRIQAVYKRLIGGFPVEYSSMNFRVGKGKNMTEPGIRSVISTLPVRSEISNYALLTPNEAADKLASLTQGSVEGVETIVFNYGLGNGCPATNRLAYKVTLSYKVTPSGSGKEIFPWLKYSRPSTYIIDADHGGILAQQGGVILD